MRSFKGSSESASAIELIITTPRSGGASSEATVWVTPGLAARYSAWKSWQRSAGSWKTSMPSK